MLVLLLCECFIAPTSSAGECTAGAGAHRIGLSGFQYTSDCSTEGVILCFSCCEKPLEIVPLTLTRLEAEGRAARWLRTHLSQLCVCWEMVMQGGGRHLPRRIGGRAPCPLVPCSTGQNILHQQECPQFSFPLIISFDILYYVCIT